jgi:2-polyprenyl-3-methyl-5-hydroxy-6-metoxy-1,4-benzoquinol methylase
MSSVPGPIAIDGIECYSPAVANCYEDYPDGGFDLTARMVETSFWVHSRNRLFKRLVGAHLSPLYKTKFLEVGCGTGDFIRSIGESESVAVTGSEIYLKGLRYAKESVPNVEFVQLDVEHDSIDDEFDVIAAFDVIEHIDDDVAAIANMTRMLRSGGALIVSAPQHRFMWRSIDEIVKHKRRYSRMELVDKLVGNGLRIERCTSFVFMLFPLMLASRLLDRKRDEAESDEKALERRVRLPTVLNRLFDFVMRIDEVMIGMGLSLPFGGTLVVVARKDAR